jgi:hypothetical protein
MSMAEYHMTKKNRRVMKDQVVNFTNGCPEYLNFAQSSGSVLPPERDLPKEG